MKKYLISTMAALALCMTACDNDDNDNKKPDEPVFENRIASIVYENELYETVTLYEYEYDDQNRIVRKWQYTHKKGEEPKRTGGSTISYGGDRIDVTNENDYKSAYELQKGAAVKCTDATGHRDFSYEDGRLSKIDIFYPTANGEEKAAEWTAEWENDCVVKLGNSAYRPSKCANNTNLDLSVPLSKFNSSLNGGELAELRLFGTPSRYVLECADNETFSYEYTYKQDAKGRLTGGTIHVSVHAGEYSHAYTDTYTITYVE